MQSEKALSRFLKNPAEAQSLRGSRYFGSWTRTLVATLKNTVFQEIPLSILHFSWTGERRVHKSSPRDRMMSFVNALRTKRPASSLGQKCGMDKPDSIAVDLKGNVLTCQNVSAAATAPNGEAHRIGHTDQMDQVALTTSTHWSKRKECPKCPVLQICKGACMFLEEALWDASCDNAYSDALPIFVAVIEFLTGLIPMHIDGELRLDRKDIFGFAEQTPQGNAVKPFPIPVVSA